MKKILTLALVVMASATFLPTMAQDTPMKSNIDSLSYALGMNVTDGLGVFLSQNFGVDDAHMVDVLEGYREGLKKINDPKYMAYVAGVQVAQMVTDRMLPGRQAAFKSLSDTINIGLFHEGFEAAMMGKVTRIDAAKAKKLEEDGKVAAIEAQKEVGRKFLAENAKKKGVVTLPSGLQYKVLRKGKGAVAKPDDSVVVKYEGTLIDGTKFDSSYDRDPQTTTFKPTQVIKGWTEALTMMPVGSKWQLFIPEHLAYGERQAGKIPPYSTLIFTVELEEIK